MSFLLAERQFFARAAAAVFILAIAGCQSTDSGTNVSGAGTTQETAPEQVSVEELRAYCPKVSLRSGTASYNTYERGGEGDPERIIYQASIEDVTRSCKYQGGTLTMNVAAAGKVVPGPVGKQGRITMPIRVAVLRGDEVLYSRLSKYQVSIAPGGAATQFIFNDANVSFPAPTAPNVQVFVGYDEGPDAAR
ncbi:hypothetical protein [Mesorhizobium xinjiangense]|uniref:hypothetical protein n=1 Tax=Mesorhizobium xinjiangense TaxID=2678685 RepID=UPI0012EE8E9C|nr:hypothetical protein [Mesorhizobium xinjiangense]